MAVEDFADIEPDETEWTPLCEEIDLAFSPLKFRDLVATLRHAQLRYGQTKNPADLEYARKIADKVDAALRWRDG